MAQAQIVSGRYNSAKIFTNDVEEASICQVKTLCDQKFAEGSKIRLMPDIHAGAGCTIGTTMTITDKICPNLVGVDIGCGMETIVFHADSPTSRTFDPEKLDKSIRGNIPSGFDIRKFPHKFVEQIAWDDIRGKYDKNRARLSLEKFRREMEGIFSTTVGKDTIDEAPMAYKPMKSIMENIGPTAEIVKVIKPIYNFKAGSEEAPWKKRR